MTIYEIKYLTRDTEPYFFSRETMRFFHQTLRDFRVTGAPGGKYLVQAPMRDNTGRVMGQTRRLFDPKTNKLERVN